MTTTDLIENPNSYSHKGFSEWWSTETEYVIQRIERWVAFAKGYNRLRSERLSRGRMTMQNEQEWTYITNNFVIGDDPEYSNTRQTENFVNKKSISEEMKINCCGTFNYKSNGNLDSNCLETYSYDHSIYFKTIGDIRRSKSTLNEEYETRDENRNDEWNTANWKSETDNIEQTEMIEFNDLAVNNSIKDNYDSKTHYKYDDKMDSWDLEENNNYITNYKAQHFVI